MSGAEEELKLAVENAGESNQLSAKVEDLKLKLRQVEETHVKCEEKLIIFTLQLQIIDYFSIFFPVKKKCRGKKISSC